MADRAADLTQKEKEALRLLLAGHDAKSAALELDISIHTLNDRLRAARRKLGVTTSKEAARALQEAEQSRAQEHPQTFVHKQIGIAAGAVVRDDQSTTLDTADRDFRRRQPSKGLIIMSTLFIAVIAAGAVYLAGLATPPDAAAPAPSISSQSQAQTQSGAQSQAQSQSQAIEWLALLDAGKFAESRAGAGNALRNRHSEQLWELGVKLRLHNHGAVLTRRLTNVNSTGAVGKMGPGDFQVLVFKSDFAKSKGVIEQVVMQRERGQWRVADYDMTKPDPF